MLWQLEKWIFQFFSSLSMAKLKELFGKVWQRVQNYLNQDLVIRSFLDKYFEAILTSKMNVALEKNIFQFFANFWVKKIKPFSGKIRQCIQNCFILNLIVGRFLGKCFEAILRSKKNALTFGKMNFSAFCKFFYDRVEIIFWESVAKRSKLFKSRFGDRKLLTKMFWRYLDLKNKCCARFKWEFFSFLKVFGWGSWKYFLGMLGKAVKTT